MSKTKARYLNIYPLSIKIQVSVGLITGTIDETNIDEWKVVAEAEHITRMTKPNS